MIRKEKLDGCVRLHRSPSSSCVLQCTHSLTLIHSDGLPASVAVLGKHGVEAMEAKRSSIPHNISLSTQLSITLEAGEMFHVPSSSLRLCTLISQDDLKMNSALITTPGVLNISK